MKHIFIVLFAGLAFNSFAVPNPLTKPQYSTNRKEYQSALKAVEKALFFSTNNRSRQNDNIRIALRQESKNFSILLPGEKKERTFSVKTYSRDIDNVSFAIPMKDGSDIDVPKKQKIHQLTEPGLIYNTEFYYSRDVAKDPFDNSLHVTNRYLSKPEAKLTRPARIGAQAIGAALVGGAYYFKDSLIQQLQNAGRYFTDKK